MSVINEVQNLYSNLISGNLAAATLAFYEKATVDSPLGGKQAATEWITEQRSWLQEHEARCVEVNTVTAEIGVSHEPMLWLTIGKDTLELPVLLVTDAEQNRIAHLRVYHSTLPITGRRHLRKPLMEYDSHTEADPLLAQLMNALSRGDRAAADQLFEPEGYVRESGGPQDSFIGENRHRFFADLLGHGCVRMKVGSVVDDGSTAVVEYTLTRDGLADRRPRAGAATYTRAGTGLLLSVRIYDDEQRSRGTLTRRHVGNRLGDIEARAARNARYSTIARSTARAATRPLALDWISPRVTPAPSPTA